MNQATDTGRLTPASTAQAPSTQRPAEHDRPLDRRTRVFACLLGLLMLAATLEIVIDGSVGHSPLIPKSPAIASWLQAPGERLGYRVFLIALLVFTVSYTTLLGLARRLPSRWLIGGVLALQLIVFAGPILISTDIFSYIAYARMGVLHGVNPYTHGPIAIHSDSVYKYVGLDWKKVATAYGPLYTLISYPVALLGVVGAVWALKLQALAASFIAMWLVWRCARLRGLDQRLALFAVAANPLYVIYGLGGAHNDLLMIMLMMAAVTLSLTHRDGAGAATVIAGALVKATVAAMLPFMLLARRSARTLIGALAALAGGLLLAYLVFGIHGVDVIAALNRDAAFVSSDSFPNELAHLVGKPGVFPIDHDLLKAALVIIVLHLLWRTWRGYDWVAASGWALLAISVTSTWLLAWYTLWSLPLAVVGRDRRLLYATLAVQGLFVIHQTAPLFAPVQ